LDGALVNVGRTHLVSYWDATGVIQFEQFPGWCVLSVFQHGVLKILNCQYGAQEWSEPYLIIVTVNYGMPLPFTGNG
jgi:hypothetical protein